MSAPCPALGFVVETAGASARDTAALAETLVRHGLEGEPDAEGRVVVRREGAQATDADRGLVLEWARAAGFRDTAVGPIVDLSDS